MPRSSHGFGSDAGFDAVHKFWYFKSRKSAPQFRNMKAPVYQVYQDQGDQGLRKAFTGRIPTNEVRLKISQDKTGHIHIETKLTLRNAQRKRQIGEIWKKQASFNPDPGHRCSHILTDGDWCRYIAALPTRARERTTQCRSIIHLTRDRITQCKIIRSLQ